MDEGVLFGTYPDISSVSCAVTNARRCIGSAIAASWGDIRKNEVSKRPGRSMKQSYGVRLVFSFFPLWSIWVLTPKRCWGTCEKLASISYLLTLCDHILPCGDLILGQEHSTVLQCLSRPETFLTCRQWQFWIFYLFFPHYFQIHLL
jgi:hypothetical protein